MNKWHFRCLPTEFPPVSLSFYLSLARAIAKRITHFSINLCAGEIWYFEKWKHTKVTIKKIFIGVYFVCEFVSLSLLVVALVWFVEKNCIFNPVSVQFTTDPIKISPNLNYYTAELRHQVNQGKKINEFFCTAYLPCYVDFEITDIVNLLLLLSLGIANREKMNLLKIQMNVIYAIIWWFFRMIEALPADWSQEFLLFCTL